MKKRLPGSERFRRKWSERDCRRRRRRGGGSRRRRTGGCEWGVKKSPPSDSDSHISLVLHRRAELEARRQKEEEERKRMEEEWRKRREQEEEDRRLALQLEDEAYAMK